VVSEYEDSRVLLEMTSAKGGSEDQKVKTCGAQVARAHGSHRILEIVPSLQYVESSCEDFSVVAYCCSAAGEREIQ